VFIGNETECTREQRGAADVSCEEGYCKATFISCFTEVKSHWLTAEEVTERKEVMRGAVEKQKWENTTMEKIEGGHMKMEKQELSGSA
jgi:hypothetical protein